jgi:hypothetical protein
MTVGRAAGSVGRHWTWTRGDVDIKLTSQVRPGANHYKCGVCVTCKDVGKRTRRTNILRINRIICRRGPYMPGVGVHKT